MSPGKKQKKIWYKLDLSANVYPTLQGQEFSSVYRLSVLLTEDIDPELMQQAIDKTLPRFPIFTTSIRKGVFWRYLEPNHKPGPFLMPDISNPCLPLRFGRGDQYLIRFYYYKNRFSMEVFHSLADGAGGMAVLKTITAVYLRLKGIPIPDTNGVYNIEETPDPGEWEDAYPKYATSGKKAKRSEGNAFRMKGTKEPFYTFNIICGVLPVDTVLKKAKSYKATLTEYLNAVLLYALLEYQKSEHKRKMKPVKIAMPVNLRAFYETKTLRNFISMVFPSIDPELGDYTFEEIITSVHHYMRYRITEKNVRADITTNAATQQHPLIRIVPLFLKDIVVKRYYVSVQNKQSSAGLTNMGRLTVPEEMKPFIDRFDIFMGQPFSPRTNCSIISYENKLTVNFGSNIKESEVEKLFFRKLVQDGIPVKVESNRNQEVI